MLSIVQGTPRPPPGSFNMAAYVLTAGQATPDKPALIEMSPQGDTIWTYARLTRAIRGTAAALHAQGLAPEDRVLMRLGNTVDFPIIYLACIWAGLIPVPTAAALTTSEVQAMRAEIDPALTVASLGVATGGGRVLSPADLQSEGDIEPQMGDPNRLAYIVYTSGSSGRPRAVCHAHRAVWARRMMWDGWYGLRPGDRMLHAGAFNWTYTLGTGLMDPWAIGATALIPHPDTDSAALSTYLPRASLFAAAPGVYRQLLRQTLPSLPDLRHGLSAGEAMPPATRDAWIKATGTQVHEALGMSECSTYLSGSPTRPAPNGTQGYPQPGRTLAVVENGAPVARGTSGIMAIHKSDPGLMLGYLGDKTPQQEWFETGDEVMMAKDGAITYLGRRDDMMNPGGFRVSPLEVEDKLRGTKGLTDIAVTHVTPEPGKTVIAAFHIGADTETLRARAKETLAPYKRPHLYIETQSLPKNANGKLNRRALRESDLWQPHLKRP